MAANPTTGRYFLVAKSGVVNEQEMRSIFSTSYPDGTAIVYQTLAAASAACLANRGDVILVAPGHTETYSTSTAITLSVAGVTIVGIGNGAIRPTFTLDTATTATINVTAANIQIANCIFVANFAAIVTCFTLTTAAEFSLSRCSFRDTSVSLNFVAIVTTDATSNHADGLRIEDCRRMGAGATTNTTLVSLTGTNARVSLKRNAVTHAAVTGGGLMIIATGKITTDAEIEDNRCLLTGASSLTTGVLITTNGSTNSGWLKGNYAQGLDDTSPILVTASSGFVFWGNYYSSVADTSAFLLPAVGT